MAYQNFDKSVMIDDIHHSLDLCGSYIQALNALCGAGTFLATNMCHSLHDTHAYKFVSLHFLAVWEEISIATAGASAAVKTETLMLLQDILNKLDIELSGDDAKSTIDECFQVIGSCLYSFVELQAQFSYSTWKAFSKLSKQFANDSLKNSLNWKTIDKTSIKQCVNTNLNSSIKKYFIKAASLKINDSNKHVKNKFSSTTTEPAFSPYYQSFNISKELKSSKLESVCPSLNNSGASSSRKPNTPTILKDCSDIPNNGTTSNPDSPDLNDVINFLSCVPVGKTSNKADQNYFAYTTTEQTHYLFPETPFALLQKTRRDDNLQNNMRFQFNLNSCLWQADTMKCTELPLNSEGTSVIPYYSLKDKHQWDCFQKLKKQSSRNSKSGDLQIFSEYKEPILCVPYNKTSTWPQKLTYRNFGINSEEKPD